MAHSQQVDFCLHVKRRHPRFFQDRLVLDMGSLDINGNNQFLFERCQYLGVDLEAGRNVDIACPIHELGLPAASIDTVISTECFEHDQNYVLSLRNIVRMLKPGGLFLFTCATTGRPEHGTRRTTPQDAPFLQSADAWGDYYRNLTEKDVRDAVDIDAVFQTYAFSVCDTTHDLYFWGIKRGQSDPRDDYSFQIARSTHDEKLSKLQGTVDELNQLLSEQHRHFERLVARTAEREESMTKSLAEKDLLHQKMLGVVSAREKELSEARQASGDAHAALQALVCSRSWRLTQPLRAAKAALQHAGRRVARALHVARTATRHLMRGDLRGLTRRVIHRYRPGPVQWPAPVCDPSRPAKTLHWGIVTTTHCQFVAQILRAHLERRGWKADIFLEMPGSFPLDMYLVIGAQMFDTLPPGERRIIYQMEQSVSSRWFTQSYLNALHTSRAVLDYSRINIAFLRDNGIRYPQVYYVPIGASSMGSDRPGAPADKTVDVLFYGDVRSSPRRQRLLQSLSRHFDVRVLTEVFRPAIEAHIRSARLVINLHYYENALLETTRIQECLTLGTPVVSESSADQDDYPELSGAVRFFAQDDVEAMIACVRAALGDGSRDANLGAATLQGSRRFGFMMDRFLIGAGFLDASEAARLHLPLADSADRIVLSLPETPDRRRMFLQDSPLECTVFDGMRRTPGWLGCALSYKALARHAMVTGKTSLLVMEDDVTLPPDAAAGLAAIQQHLQAIRGQWDIFAGLIAVLHPGTRVLHAERKAGTTFVTINRMTSMVFNIYGLRALHLLADWDERNADAEHNTIDRYIERQPDLRVVTTLPFFAGHREEVASTLWGFENSQYSEMIRASEAALQKKVETWFSEQARPAREPAAQDTVALQTDA